MSATAATRRPALLVVAALLFGLLAAAFMNAGSASATTAHHSSHHGHHHGKKHHHKKHHHHHHTVVIRQSSASRGFSGSTPRATSTETTIANQVLSLLNSERAANHLPALSMASQLVSSARSHNLAMARTNTMSHQCSGESDLGTRETRAGYKWSWAGENIGWNSQMTAQGVLQLEQMMYNEQPPNDGHRLNILNSHFKNIGVDVYMDNTNHKVWLTTDFGRH